MSAGKVPEHLSNPHGGGPRLGIHYTFPFHLWRSINENLLQAKSATEVEINLQKEVRHIYLSLEAHLFFLTMKIARVLHKALSQGSHLYSRQSHCLHFGRAHHGEELA